MDTKNIIICSNPECKSKNVIPSRRRGWEKLTRFFSFQTPFRCKECWNRFHVRRHPLKVPMVRMVSAGVVVFIVLPFTLIHARNYFDEKGSSPKENIHSFQRTSGKKPDQFPAGVSASENPAKVSVDTTPLVPEEDGVSDITQNAGMDKKTHLSEETDKAMVKKEPDPSLAVRTAKDETDRKQAQKPIIDFNGIKIFPVQTLETLDQV